MSQQIKQLELQGHNEVYGLKQTVHIGPKSSTQRSPDATTAASDPDSGCSSDEEDITYCEVRSTPEKGQGLYATRAIRPGTLLFREQPLISLSKELEESYEAIEAAFAGLRKCEKKTYLALFDAKKSRMSTVVSVYYSNCYSTEQFATMDTVPSFDGGSCIGAKSSRINHSCVPNVLFSFVTPCSAYPEGQMRFYAIKAIARGRELVSNYDKNVFEPAAKRQQKYMLHYGFRCACEACHPQTEFWNKSDERRGAMKKAIGDVQRLEREWQKAVDAKDMIQRPVIVQQAIERLLKLEGLLRKETLTYIPLANVYRSLTKWSQRGGEDGRSWSQLELEVVTTVFGRRSSRSARLQKELVVLEQDAISHHDL